MISRSIIHVDQNFFLKCFFYNGDTYEIIQHKSDVREWLKAITNTAFLIYSTFT